MRVWLLIGFSGAAGRWAQPTRAKKGAEAMRIRMLQIAVLVGVAVATLAAQAKALPEFMNAQQLTVWRAQHAAPPAAVTQVPDEQTLFFTGKPFDSASGTYLFKYRSYSPSIARWTSIDPSGFPDGANNYYYAPVPNRQVDRFGLFYDGCVYDGYMSDLMLWMQCKLFAGHLTTAALNHADGTTPGNWSLSNSDAALIEDSDLYKGNVRQDAQQYLEDSSPADGNLLIPSSHYHFDLSDIDANFAIGGVEFGFNGTVTSIFNNTEAFYDASVTFNKNWTFAGHSGDNESWYNALGYRLETYGWIYAFQLSGTFSDEWKWAKE
jgi:RHS repeat-associated protein